MSGDSERDRKEAARRDASAGAANALDPHTQSGPAPSPPRAAKSAFARTIVGVTPSHLPGQGQLPAQPPAHAASTASREPTLRMPMQVPMQEPSASHSAARRQPADRPQSLPPPPPPSGAPSPMRVDGPSPQAAAPVQSENSKPSRGEPSVPRLRLDPEPARGRAANSSANSSVKRAPVATEHSQPIALSLHARDHLPSAAPIAAPTRSSMAFVWITLGVVALGGLAYALMRDDAPAPEAVPTPAAMPTEPNEGAADDFVGDPVPAQAAAEPADVPEVAAPPAAPAQAPKATVPKATVPKAIPAPAKKAAAKTVKPAAKAPASKPVVKVTPASSDIDDLARAAERLSAPPPPPSPDE